MTYLEQAIRDAVEKGGYMDADDFEFERSYPVTIGFVKNDKIINRVSPYQVFLDPLFWQALGKARGWNKEFRIGDIVITPHGEGRITSVENFKGGTTRVRYKEGGLSKYSTWDIQPKTPSGEWSVQWNSLIDHLASGHDIESFFKELSGKEK